MRRWQARNHCPLALRLSGRQERTRRVRSAQARVRTSSMSLCRMTPLPAATNVLKLEILPATRHRRRDHSAQR